MKNRYVHIWLAAAALASMTSNVATQSSPSTIRYVDGEILIQFRSSVGPADTDDARGRVGAARKQLLRRSVEGELELASVPAGSVANAIAVLQRHPAVEFVEPNYILEHQATPNDPYYVNGQLWGVYGDLSTPSNQFGSQAAEVWAGGETGSASVIVGVIDEGVDFNHPDLAGRVWVNPFDPVDGVDNDGNGYVDDSRGWDFYHNDNTVYDGPGDNHGTHVAGTIGAIGNNGVGIVGVNWNVTMISAKFLEGSGTTANAVLAVDYLTDLRVRHGLNIVASNNSWGGGGYSSALHAAIIRAAKQGILFVAAAGNGSSNNDVFAFYPAAYDTRIAAGGETAASYDSVISVAAIDSVGNKASFSNYGATTVDLGAPGVSILSTTPANTYSFYNGTSMATPHVTGGIALYRSIVPAATAAETRIDILNTALATPTASLSGITVTNGRLNLGALFTSPATPNLRVSALSNPPAVVVLKEKFNATDTTTNDGTGSADPSQTDYYLSTDTTLGPGDKKFGAKRLVSALAGGDSSTGSKTLTVPGSTKVGVYYLLACADATNVVSEDDETDNCFASATTVDVRAPNLKITTVSNPPPNVAAGGSFSLIDTVLNTGNASAGPSGTLYYLSTSATKKLNAVQLLGSKTVSALSAGNSSTAAVNLTVHSANPLGTYYVLACADDAKKVPESNERDNCTAAPTQLTVTP